MHDEAGEDAKIICVPPDEPRWDGVKDLTDLSESFHAEIKHFFDVYKASSPARSRRLASSRAAKQPGERSTPRGCGRSALPADARSSGDECGAHRTGALAEHRGHEVRPRPVVGA